MASEQMVLDVQYTVTGVPEDIAMQGLVEKATDGLTPSSITSKFNFSRENLIEIGIYFGIGFVAGFLIKKYSHLIVGIGLIILAVMALQYFGFLTVVIHCDKIQQVLGVEPALMNGSLVAPCMAWAKEKTVAAVSFVVGLVLGLWVG